jgi:hypothetical protein
VNVPAGEYANLSAGGRKFLLHEPLPGGGPAHFVSSATQSASALPRRFSKASALIRSQATRRSCSTRQRGWRRNLGRRFDRTSGVKVGDGPINVAALEMRIDPREEWQQIFRETWRIQREYFYDAKMHGNNWQAIYDKYKPLVEHVGHRADLSYVIAMVGGELTVGHSYLTGPGDVPGEDAVSVGLLGADYAVENGYYRIKKIYTGENWNPELRAPLSAPGIQVAEGDYIVEVNGRPLTSSTNIYSQFEGTANDRR